MLLPVAGGVWWLLVASIVLGLGQTLQLTALQGEVATFRLRRHREGMVGGLMLWQAIGQVSAPMILSLTALAGGPLPQRLALVASALALVCTGLGFVLWRYAAEPRGASLRPLAIGQIFSVSGLGWVMLSGSLCVAVYDLALIYLPVIGAARGIPAEMVGVLLTLLACGQMLSRALYPWVQTRAGPRKLMLGGVLGTAVLTLTLSLPIHILAVGTVLGLIGVTMGFAITSSVALTMTLAPPGARATSLGLRLAMNRAGQFVIPLAAGGAAAMLGAGAVFFVLGLVLCGIALQGPRALSRSEPGSQVGS
jgi:MFS family permease